MTLPPTNTGSTEVALRASDADREHTARVIHTAAGAGMLTLAETEERLGAVYTARFRRELTPLVVDLPVDDAAAVAGRWWHHIWALLVAMPTTAAGWALRHRGAAVLIGVVALGVAGLLTLALGEPLLPDGMHSGGGGAEVWEH